MSTRHLIGRANRAAETAQQLSGRGADDWPKVCAHLADARRHLAEADRQYGEDLAWVARLARSSIEIACAACLDDVELEARLDSLAQQLDEALREAGIEEESCS